jgi:magnesium transporter
MLLANDNRGQFFPAIDRAQVVAHRRGHPTKTAGALVRAGALALAETSTVGDAIEALRRHEPLDATAAPNYVYVIDRESRPVGVLSLRDLVLSRPHLPLSRVMRAPIVSVEASRPAEAVARVLRRHRYGALPVVDASGRFVGVITADDVMDVIETEATEEVQQMFGAGAEERLTSPWSFSFRRRLPWLLVNLGLAALGASVVTFFEGTIGAWTVLAMYMPIVAGMGGNASAQAMAVAIRGIAVGDADRLSLRRVIGRELRVGVASGLVVGAAAAAVATVVHYDQGPLLAVLVAASLLINHAVACAWGAAIPFLMRSLGFDPAQSATIFTTTLTDMLGFFTLLGLATLSLNLLK